MSHSHCHYHFFLYLNPYFSKLFLKTEGIENESFLFHFLPKVKNKKTVRLACFDKLTDNNNSQ